MDDMGISWIDLQTVGDPKWEQSYSRTLYKETRQGKTHDQSRIVHLLAYLAYSVEDSIQILPVPGVLSLASAPGTLAVTLVQTGQLPFLSYILGVALQSTNPPIASLLDNNWISRAIEDLPLEEIPQPWKDGKAFIWLMPEMYQQRTSNIIKGHMLSNRRSASSSNRAWGLGWT